MSGWQQLGAVSPRALTDARLQLHWSCQLAAAPGKVLAEPEDDYRHTALAWIDTGRQLAGARFASGLRVALRPADLTLALLDESLATLDQFPLPKTTIDAGLAWLGEVIEAHAGSPPGLDDVRSDLPSHPVGEGATIDADPRALRELSKHFANADCLLGAESRSLDGASEVSLWPHHLDMSTLWSIDKDADPEQARSVNLGMALGDNGIDEPYWFVTPWPAPDTAKLPDLEVGEWNTEGWVGAVLPSSAMPGPSEAQQRLVADFIQGSLDASKQILGV